MNARPPSAGAGAAATAWSRLSGRTDSRASDPARQMRLAYLGVFLFVAVYYTRPNDWLPGVGAFPFAKIAGAIAILGFAIGLLLGRRTGKLQPEQIVLLSLYGWFLVTIPFSSWKGGSFSKVTGDLFKIYLMALIITMAVTTMPRLRRIIYLQGLITTTMAILVALGFGSTLEGKFVRAQNVIGGAFGNPNELANALALGLPFCVIFMLWTRNVVLKGFWLVSIGLATYGVVASYSRGGFLALAVAVMMLLWEFAIRGKRRYLFFPIAGAVVLTLILAGTTQYGGRLASIFAAEKDVTGSSMARSELLKLGLAATARNPIFGVGPAQFPAYTGTWRVPHNTYVQLSSEAGIPGAALFITLLYFSFRNLQRAKAWFTENDDGWMMAGALRASLASYAIAALFVDSGYHFFPYILMGYASCLYRITRQRQAAEGAAQPSPASGERSARPVVSGFSHAASPQAPVRLNKTPSAGAGGSTRAGFK